MKIVLITIGKTNNDYLIDGINDYTKRLKKYSNFEIIDVPNVKNTKHLSDYELIKKEGEATTEVQCKLFLTSQEK